MKEKLIELFVRIGIPSIFFFIGFIVIKYNKELNKMNYRTQQKWLQTQFNEEIINSLRIFVILGGIFVIVLGFIVLININRDLITIL